MRSKFTLSRGYRIKNKNLRNSTVYYTNCRMALQLYTINKTQLDKNKKEPRLPQSDPRRKLVNTYHHPPSFWRINNRLTANLFPFKKLIAKFSSSVAS